MTPGSTPSPFRSPHERREAGSLASRKSCATSSTNCEKSKAGRAARHGKDDVGEIRRALNSFLQFLEQDEPESLLVAATNHPDLLDQAMFRRFEAVIEYPLPSGVSQK